MASVLKVDQLQKPDGSTPTAADLGLDVSGSVVQVVSNYSTGGSGTTSTSWTEVQAFINVTPKKSDSILVVTFHSTAYVGPDGAVAYFTITRDGVPIGNASENSIAQMVSRASSQYQPSSLQTYTTSNSTATTTFKVAVKMASSGNVYFPPGSPDQWTATVYEIAQ